MLELTPQKLDKLSEGQASVRTENYGFLEKPHGTLLLLVEVVERMVEDIERLNQVGSVHPRRKKVELYGFCSRDSSSWTGRYAEVMGTWNKLGLTVGATTEAWQGVFDFPHMVVRQCVAKVEEFANM